MSATTEIAQSSDHQTVAGADGDPLSLHQLPPTDARSLLHRSTDPHVLIDLLHASGPVEKFVLGAQPVYSSRRDPAMNQRFASYNGLAPYYMEPRSGPLILSNVDTAQFSGLHTGHYAAAEHVNRNFAYVEAILGLKNLDPRLRGTGPSSSSAIREALRIARNFHADARVNSGRQAIICSAASHRAVRMCIPQDTHLIPVDAETGQMNDDALVEAVRKHRPAIVFYTLGTTDKGSIEVPSERMRELVRESKREGAEILLGFDATLLALIMLQPDRPAYPGDNGYLLKELAKRALSGDEPALIVANVSKTIGYTNSAQLRVRNVTHEVARETICLSLNLPKDSLTSSEPIQYVPGGGSWETTVGTLPIIQTNLTIEKLGLWGLRWLAFTAKRDAGEMADLLRSFQLPIEPVSVNSLVVRLPTHEASTVLQQCLKEEADFEVACSLDAVFGNRIVFNLGGALTEYSKETMALMVRAAYDHATGNRYSWPANRHPTGFDYGATFTVDRRHHLALQPFYGDGQEPIPNPEPPPQNPPVSLADLNEVITLPFKLAIKTAFGFRGRGAIKAVQRVLDRISIPADPPAETTALFQALYLSRWRFGLQVDQLSASVDYLLTWANSNHRDAVRTAVGLARSSLEEVREAVPCDLDEAAHWDAQLVVLARDIIKSFSGISPKYFRERKDREAKVISLIERNLKQFSPLIDAWIGNHRSLPQVQGFRIENESIYWTTLLVNRLIAE